jgi:nucleoside permease NupC
MSPVDTNQGAFMFTTGLAIFLGLVFVLAKLKRRVMLRLLHHDALLDIAVTVLVLYVHWGSFEGVMAATIAGLFTSVATTFAKRMFGYIKGGEYVPGHFRLEI